MTNLKPTNDFSNISFKYICPECGYDHWYFLHQLQMKGGFKDICDCGHAFELDTIDTIEIIYKHRPKPNKVEIVESVQQEGLTTMTLNACKHTLSTFGYNDEHIQNMIEQSYEIIKENDPTALVKYAIENFGG
tara:strand:- start:382 stop:780 length:399 start_codon:yes stop_codon:yes gene_type:complete